MNRIRERLRPCLNNTVAVVVNANSNYIKTFKERRKSLFKYAQFSLQLKRLGGTVNNKEEGFSM